MPGLTRYLFVGRFIERKGIEVLLDAFRRLEAGELWIAGDGPLRGAVEATLASNLRTRILGHLDGAALADVYRQVDVLVVPSLYEPWGLVVHEGLAYGLPAIVTDQVGAGDDLIAPGVNGYVVRAGSSQDLADSMRAVAAWTEGQRERAVRRSAETLRACSIDRSVEGFVRGCSLALEHRRRRDRTKSAG